MKLALSRASGIALAWVCASVLWVCAARAEPPNSHATPVYVLTVWTNDSDDQADALTQQLRSRVRQVSGWSLLDSTQSFETLAIALRCPPTPSAACLDRIGEHLHADHYIWATMAKEKAGEVTADVRLWSRGKPQVEASETYSDNLKDPSDDALRAIAGKLIGKVLGTSTPTGVLVVHAGSGKGTVLVDGASKGTLEEGTARLNVPVGQHTVSVRLSGFEAESKPATIAEGTEEEVTVPLSPVASEATHAEPEAESTPERQASPFPVRKVLAYSALVAGAALIVGGVVEAIAWENDRNTSNNDRTNVPPAVTNVCSTGGATLTASEMASAQDACARNSSATGASTAGWIFSAVGAAFVGTGIVLLITDPGHPSTTEPAQASNRPSPTRPSVSVLPSFGPHGGMLGLHVTF